jgi:hypothetical protein
MFQLLIHTTLVKGGLETALSVFLLVWLLLTVVTRRGERPGLASLLGLGVLAGLSILARLDNIFLVALLGAWYALGFATTALRNLVVGDLAWICAAGFISYFLRLGAGGIYAQNSGSLPVLVGLGFLSIPISLFLFGMYAPGRARPAWQTIARTVLAASAAAAATGLILLLLQKAGLLVSLPRSVIVINWALLLPGLVLLRLVLRLGTGGEPAGVAAEFGPAFWKQFLTRGLGYFLPLVFLVGGYLLWNQLTLGTFMPVSGEIKHWWGTLPNPAYGQLNRAPGALLGLSVPESSWELALQPAYAVERIARVRTGSETEPAACWATAGVLLVFGLAVLLPQRRWLGGLADQLPLFVLFAGAVLQILSFTSTTYVGAREWYWASEFLLTTVVIGILLECVFLNLRKVGLPAVYFHLTLAVWIAALMTGFFRSLARNFPAAADAHAHEYLASAALLEANTEPGAVIGMTGSGASGYFIRDRLVLNMDGLINSPEYFASMRHGQTQVFLNRMGLDYVFGRGFMLLDSDPYMGVFRDRLEVLVELEPFGTLYRYNPLP